MSFLVPKVKTVPLPPVPKLADATAEQAAAEARDAERRRRGTLANILTSGQGVAGPAPVQRKTLLGE
jgi:hypothetical protein